MRCGWKQGFRDWNQFLVTIYAGPGTDCRCSLRPTGLSLSQSTEYMLCGFDWNEWSNCGKRTIGMYMEMKIENRTLYTSSKSCSRWWMHHRHLNLPLAQIVIVPHFLRTNYFPNACLQLNVIKRHLWASFYKANSITFTNAGQSKVCPSTKSLLVRTTSSYAHADLLFAGLEISKSENPRKNCLSYIIKRIRPCSNESWPGRYCNNFTRQSRTLDGEVESRRRKTNIKRRKKNALLRWQWFFESATLITDHVLQKTYQITI